jgi:predicted RNase H-like HicB family nuclease
MQIPVLVERIAKNGYRARSQKPFGVSARGATREEARPSASHSA